MATLYMLLIGCSPKGRHTEQHDVFFGIGNHISDLFDDVNRFWPEAKGTLHLDAWRAVTLVDGYAIRIVEAHQAEAARAAQLFFINLGGYKRGEFEEFHYKMLVAAPDKGQAVLQAKQTAFYKHTGFKGANSHIDDKWGIDLDDIYAIKDVLPPNTKNNYSVLVEPTDGTMEEDPVHLGYFKLDKVDKWAPKT